MSKIICVTNRILCNDKDSFLEKIKQIADCRPAGIMLREKDLSADRYESLAARVLEICRAADVLCILHSHADSAARLHANALHVPLSILRTMTDEQKERFDILGASCHSAFDAREAERLGCTYITAGHVFDTECKRGLPGRGCRFLQMCAKQ